MSKLSRRKVNCCKVEIAGKMKHLSNEKHIDYLAHAAARQIVFSYQLLESCRTSRRKFKDLIGE